MLSIKVKDPITKAWKSFPLGITNPFNPAPINDRIDVLSSKVEGKQNKMIKKNNILASKWDKTNTYPTFPYSCNIAMEGLKPTDYAEVIFNINEAVSGKYAPICSTSTNILTIYSSTNIQINIPTIIIYK